MRDVCSNDVKFVELRGINFKTDNNTNNIHVFQSKKNQNYKA